MTRTRRTWALLLLFAILATTPQSFAGTKRSTLRCKWTGIVHAIDETEGYVIFDIGPGTGHCDFDGTGRYDITSLQGSGQTLYEGIDILGVSVRYTIRRRSDGGVRTFEQVWTGLGDGILGYPFVVQEAANLPVRGIGVADVPSPFGAVGDFDAPASFEWTFLKPQK